MSASRPSQPNHDPSIVPGRQVSVAEALDYDAIDAEFAAEHPDLYAAGESFSSIGRAVGRHPVVVRRIAVGPYQNETAIGLESDSGIEENQRDSASSP